MAVILPWTQNWDAELHICQKHSPDWVADATPTAGIGMTAQIYISLICTLVHAWLSFFDTKGSKLFYNRIESGFGWTEK